MIIIGYILLGLASGVVGGLLGIGGAVIMVPVLIYIFGFGQHSAQGTAIAAMVPPIGLWAAFTYYQKDWVNLKAALFISLAFLVGGFFGAKIAVTLSPSLLRKIFAAVLLLLAVKMFMDN
ncbi:MAG: sulfite exporter TauE/SafE family protein [Planctomycetota bacterium]